MLKKLIKALKNRSLWNSICIRLRLVLRISNKNVYAEYLRCREYSYLERKYREIIQKGANENLKHEKCDIIWICWLQGLDSAPELVKACVHSVKTKLWGKNVKIITEKNFDNYVELPDYIVSKYKKGIIPPAQFTDILRTALLCRYGGGWIDATVFCSCEELPDYIKDSSLFVYKQVDLLNRDYNPVALSNWLIFSETNHPILLLTLNLLMSYWKSHNRLSHYFIYHLFFTMATRRYPLLWASVPTYDNRPPHILQKELCSTFSERRWEQLKRQSDFHKLNRRIFSSDSKSFYSYIVNTIKDV